MQSTYDVLIIGSGPAGSIAAYEAAKRDLRVLLIDKKETIGKPVQCAEYIPKLLLNKVTINNECIAQDIIGMKTYFPNEKTITTISPGVILNRDIFDKSLALQAEDEGATILSDTKCVSLHEKTVTLQRKGKKLKITPTIIIGADGPNSTVGKYIQYINQEFIHGLQYTVPLIEPMKHTEIYFKNQLFGGYGWLFPKGSKGNVGIGIKLKPGQKKDILIPLLEDFIHDLIKMKKIYNDPIKKTQGLIPVGGPLRSVKNNIILVGDAAGQTHPITGGGIPQAVICGKIAGNIASQAVYEDISLLNRYEEEWMHLFNSELQRAKIRRIYLEQHWENLEIIIKKCWPIFREYYEN